MKAKLIIPFMIILAALLLVKCKSCDCGFQPPKAKKVNTWVKR